MKRTTMGAAFAATLLFTGMANAACIDDVNMLSSELEALHAEASEVPSAGQPDPAAADAEGRTTQGEALTGDPLNPRPGPPTTAEAPTTTPTSEEGEGVMPGADASVELVGEDLAQVTVLVDQAREASEAGDEDACAAALDEARVLMELTAAAD